MLLSGMNECSMNSLNDVELFLTTTWSSQRFLLPPLLLHVGFTGLLTQPGPVIRAMRLPPASCSRSTCSARNGHHPPHLCSRPLQAPLGTPFMLPLTHCALLQMCIKPLLLSPSSHTASPHYSNHGTPR